MDPIERINIAKDSTFAMLLAAQARGWALRYMQLPDLRIDNGQARAQMRPVTVRDDRDDWFDLGDIEDDALESLDIILMRKDPPFDMEYIYATYVLDLAAAAGVLVSNPPQALRDLNEKAACAWFPALCPATLITRSMRQMRDFLDIHERIVVKPLDGMGGKSIFVIERGDLNTGVVLETLTGFGTRFAMAQAHVAEIDDGDKRILIVDGEPVDYCLARIPAPGESRGNLAAGARAESRPLSESDRNIALEVGAFLAARDVTFAGIDVIGDRLTEINVTSPTCIRELDRDFGLDIAGDYLDALGRRL
ncbi:MAG: glutathione synthase [Gammaproteobacteria bacterium]|nr:glutathione synthase [Gammaproteobacteria bacterium]